MIIRHSLQPLGSSKMLRPERLLRVQFARRAFSSSKPSKGQNRIYTPVRLPDELYSYQRLSSTAQKPLVTLWTTSWCSTCRVISPHLASIIESGAGEAFGGVSFCEVEYDAPDIMSSKFAMDYMITSIPTLLAFDGEYPLIKERIMDASKLKDEAFIRAWIEDLAKKYGGGEDGGGLGKGLLGGLFGSK